MTAPVPILRLLINPPGWMGFQMRVLQNSLSPIFVILSAAKNLVFQ